MDFLARLKSQFEIRILRQTLGPQKFIYASTRENALIDGESQTGRAIADADQTRIASREEVPDSPVAVGRAMDARLETDGPAARCGARVHAELLGNQELRPSAPTRILARQSFLPCPCPTAIF